MAEDDVDLFSPIPSSICFDERQSGGPSIAGELNVMFQHYIRANVILAVLCS